MKYSYLGSTGVQVSRISLGTATFGVAPREAEVLDVVHKALDFGINVFDTANSYGNQARFDRTEAPPSGERASSEELLGLALKGRRSEVILSSKVMEAVGKGPNDRGLSRRHIVQQVENSLRRLQTDYLDIYYAHHPDPRTSLDQTLRTFDDLVRDGKIRYFALSTFPAWQVMEAAWVCDRLLLQTPACNQIPYNLATREAELDMFPVCERLNLSLTAFGPLAGGLLAGSATRNRPLAGRKRWGGPEFTSQQLRVAEQLEAIAEDSGHAPAVLALAWLLTKPHVASAIIGPEDVHELEATSSVVDLEIATEVLDAVDCINRPQRSY